jgi:hypothetical protein
MSLSENQKQELEAMSKQQLIQEYMDCLERTGKALLKVRRKVEKVENWKKK